MSEYNIVPRTNGDGNIGTPAKKWNGIYANSINKEALPNATSENKGAVVVGDNITVNNGTISITESDVVAALGYYPATNNDMLQPSTTYAVGDQVYHSKFQKGLLLECIQAGTTSAEEPVELGHAPTLNSKMVEPSTTYAVGDQVYSNQLPYGMMLECVQAGTTDSNELDLTEYILTLSGTTNQTITLTYTEPGAMAVTVTSTSSDQTFSVLTGTTWTASVTGATGYTAGALSASSGTVSANTTISAEAATLNS